MSKATGTFIVRENDDNQLVLSVSVLEGNDVKHYIIHQVDDGGFSISTWSRFSTLNELIAHYQSDGLPVNLSKPFLEKNSTTKQPHFQQDLIELPLSSIWLTEMLREGECSEIWKGIWRYREGAMNVSVKLPKFGCEIKEDLLKEAMIINGLRHPHVLRLHGVCSKENPMFIVTEFFEKGSLLNYLQRLSEKSMKANDLVLISAQVASGMAYLEKCNIVHRSLAARNVFVAERNIVKIGNFARARSLEEEGSFTEPNARVLIRWMAPEALFEWKFSTKSDVWSFGILLYEIITNGIRPYPGMSNEEVIIKIKEGYRLQQPVRCPHWLYMIILDCWKPEAEDRPTFEALQYNLESSYKL